MKFRAEIELLPEMIGLIREAIEGLDRSTQNKIELASEEALVNIITHAQSEKIEIGVKLIVDSHVEITIQDWGPPFNPLEKSQVDTHSPLAERKVGGLGIHLMKQMMDEVRYQRIGDTNQLILIKKLK